MRKGWRKTFTKQVLCKMLRLMNAAYYIGHIGGNKIQLLWRGCPLLRGSKCMIEKTITWNLKIVLFFVERSINYVLG